MSPADQYTVGAAQVSGDVGLQVVADVVGVPAGSGEQVLQSIGGGVADVFGKLPAILRATGASSART